MSNLQDIENEIAAIEPMQKRLNELLAERTRIKNEQFAAMTPAEKRVNLAQDVIMQLNAELITAEQGTYLSLHEENSLKCDACALGSLFICSVTKPELALDIDDLVDMGDRESMQDHLEGIFDHAQLDMIETAFEMDPYMSYPEDLDLYDESAVTAFDDLVDKTIEFGRKYDDDKARLIAIMENVVANKGTFVP